MLDLKLTYGKRYKIGIDPSWDAENTQNRSTFRQNGEEPYYYELLGKYGKLYNHSLTHLQIWITPKLGAKLNRSLPSGWKLHQNASDAYTFILPNSDISIAFKWIKPRKRRVGPTDPATIARLRQFSKLHGFKKTGQVASTQSVSSPVFSSNTPKPAYSPLVALETPITGRLHGN